MIDLDALWSKLGAHYNKTRSVEFIRLFPELSDVFQELRAARKVISAVENKYVTNAIGYFVAHEQSMAVFLALEEYDQATARPGHEER